MSKKKKNKKQATKIQVVQPIILRNKNSKKEGRVLWVIGIIVTIGLFLITSNFSTTFTSTITISGWDKWDEVTISALMREEIVLDNNFRQRMNANGQVIFTKIPNDYRGKTVSVHITNSDSQRMPFFLTDSVVAISNNRRINSPKVLTVGLRGLDKLEGIVKNENGIGIPNATIIVAGIECRTGDRGFFSVEIPIDKQRQQQKVEISKSGYRPFRANVPIIGEVPLQIVLPFD